MMKFNQKVYLIPAVKYEKLLGERQQPLSTNETSDDVKTSAETTIEQPDTKDSSPSDFFSESKVGSEESSKSKQDTENSRTEYSQHFSIENKPKKTSKSNIPKVIFPPPGEPDKSEFEKASQSKKKHEKNILKNSPPKKKQKLENKEKITRWVKLR